MLGELVITLIIDKALPSKAQFPFFVIGVFCLFKFIYVSYKGNSFQFYTLLEKQRQKLVKNPSFFDKGSWTSWINVNIELWGANRFFIWDLASQVFFHSLKNFTNNLVQKTAKYNMYLFVIWCGVWTEMLKNNVFSRTFTDLFQHHQGSVTWQKYFGKRSILNIWKHVKFNSVSKTSLNEFKIWSVDKRQGKHMKLNNLKKWGEWNFKYKQSKDCNIILTSHIQLFSDISAPNPPKIMKRRIFRDTRTKFK